MQNQAAEVKLRAERKAGIFSSRLKLRGGDRKSKGHRAPLKLEELGINGDESKRWQLMASVPSHEFESWVTAKKGLSEEITAAELLRLARGLPSIAPIYQGALKCVNSLVSTRQDCQTATIKTGTGI